MVFRRLLVFRTPKRKSVSKTYIYTHSAKKLVESKTELGCCDFRTIEVSEFVTPKML